MPTTPLAQVFADSEMRLPFGKEKQTAILWYLITDTNFFAHAHFRIEPRWFDDALNAKVYEALLKFYKAQGRTPTLQELKDSSSIMEYPIPEQNRLRAQIDIARGFADQYRLDLLRRNLTEWLHARIYREGLDSSTALFKQERFHDAYTLIADRVRLIQETRFEAEDVVTFSEPAKWLIQSERDYDEACSFGLKLMDDALVPSGVSRSGGLFRGDTTVLLAPVNVGKTTAMITTIAANLHLNRDVFWVSLEGRPDDLREKLLCSFLKLNKPALFERIKDPVWLRYVHDMGTWIDEHLLYVPFNRGGMTVEELMAVIRRKHEEWMMKKERRFDLLVVDYPAKLTTERAKGGQFAKRNIDDIVYEYFVQAALEFKLHALLAIQTNREGSRANQEEERLLTMEDVMESWGPMASATNVISLNRSHIDAARGRMTFYIAKSRSSDVGKAIVAKTDFSASVTHCDAMGSTWYRGREPLGDQVDEYMRRFNGKEIIFDGKTTVRKTDDKDQETK